MTEPFATLLGGATPAEFLARHWQKTPLLIRAALPGLHNPLTPEELAALACQEQAEARIVLENGRHGPWEARHGPFAEEDFQALPASGWTLLVQDVDKLAPASAWLLDGFSFLPSWRRDDLMVSYAVPGGSVGPHIDQYDVFLLQGLGRRRWQIDPQPCGEDDLVADTELRILRRFEPRQEWVLEPGDMLYLPPGVAHHGVALDHCMTYSIGFRGPGAAELTTAFLEHCALAAGSEVRYQDPDLQPARHPGEIDRTALERLRAFLRQQLRRGDADLERWLGRFLTEPKPGDPLEPLPSPPGRQALAAPGAAVHRDPYARFAFVARDDGGVYCYASGQEYPVAAPGAQLARTLSAVRTLSHADLRPYLEVPECVALLTALLADGHLRLTAE